MDTKAIPVAQNTLANCVDAPASKLTTDLEKPPVTGNAPEIADATLAAPKPTNSWLTSNALTTLCG